MPKKELIDCKLAFFHETEFAILCAETEDAEEGDRFWLPKSQIEWTEGASKGDIVDVTIPEWLAMEKGII